MSAYELIRSRRRTLALEITRDCRVLVRAPLRASKTRIDEFVAAHEDWIALHLERQRRRQLGQQQRLEHRAGLRLGKRRIISSSMADMCML